ncbi:MAG TPA: transglycosylase SLT domain-containing protein [Bradyrhizobium sp.]|nr:transglycosylase SLT domain-containing protein [Bradyrhizobium sp.]
MRFWQLTCFAAAFAASPLCATVVAKMSTDQSNWAEEEGVAEQPSSFFRISTAPATFAQRFSVLLQEEEPDVELVNMKETRLEQEDLPWRDHSAGATPADLHSPYLGFSPDAELPLDKKPADIVLESLKNIPVGTPFEEIKRAADAFGLDPSFMEAVAQIESNFDPKQHTGSYIGLFQLSRSEFRKYCSGDITSPRDNAVAAAYKLVTEARLFEQYTHTEPTVSDLYLIHQQGWRGAAEHVSHPERIAWKSMCATDEGRLRGERWCKRAIWGNTLPIAKHDWKSVNKMTSDAFVSMWRQRIDKLYSRYSETAMAANEDQQ